MLAICKLIHFSVPKYMRYTRENQVQVKAQMFKMKGVNEAGCVIIALVSSLICNKIHFQGKSALA